MTIPPGKLPTDLTTVSISYFALDELTGLHGKGMKTKKDDVVGALVLAAKRAPVESVKAVVETYAMEEARIAAVTAVASWIRAHAPTN